MEEERNILTIASLNICGQTGLNFVKQKQIQEIYDEKFILLHTLSQLIIKSLVKEAGYEVMMLYVYTDLETSLKRNQERFEKSGGEDRSLLPGSVLSAWKGVTQNFKDYQNLFGDNFISVANTGDSETMKDIENILKTYVDPFKVKDGRQKTEKELARSNAQKAKLNQDIQDILQSDQIQNIINSSVSKEEAQNKINAFIR